MQQSETSKIRDSRNGKWDKLYSTFHWTFEMDPMNNLNNPSVGIICGYSKKEGQDEAIDKQYLLMRKIHTLAGVQGYLKRTRRMEFYAKKEKIIDKTIDPVVVTLFPQTFHFSEQFLKAKYEPLHRFLGDLYDHILQGKQIDHLLPKRKISFSKDDYFNVESLFFNTIAQLDLYCAKLVRNGHPFDQAMNFHRNYLLKKPFKNV